MAVRPLNHGDGWSDEDIGFLKTLAAERLPLALISKKLGRTETSVKAKAKKLGVALKIGGAVQIRSR